jgi:UDPglucose 6-dehydrogenase
LKTAEDHQSPIRIVEAVVKVNDARKRAMGRKVIRALGDEPRGKTVALLGLTFKPNTDDMRDAPSIAIFQALDDVGVKVRGYDPEGIEQARPMMPGMEFRDSPYAAAEGADAVVLVTEWDVLRALDLKRLRGKMSGNALIDLRNVYTPEEVIAAGFEWQGIGKPGLTKAHAPEAG